jgi:hypothetical protein
MTDEQINIRIAEVCGWTDCEYVESLGLCKGRNRYLIPQYETGHSIIPNYAGCLNAMHDAEKILNFEEAEFFEYDICDIIIKENDVLENPLPLRFSICHATARQRAEAFLRILGKWEESK